VAVTAFYYHRFFLSAMNKEVDIDTDNIKVLLTTSAYVPSKTAHRYMSDIFPGGAFGVAPEVSGTGYTAGGLALTGESQAYDGSSVWNFTASADPTWASSTITGARIAVFYDQTPAAFTAKALISYVDFGADQSTAGGNFVLQLNAGGIVKVTVS
jgi:hypothetical protein